MRLTTKSEYAIIALLFIARGQASGYIRSEEICDAYSLSKKYLERILTQLKRSNVILTKRGITGGYKLNLPPEKINVADIVRLMDGPIAPLDSVSTFFYNHTILEREHKFHTVLKEIRDYTANRLERLSLRDIM